MNITLIGYGTMGKAIETIAVQRGHNISLIIDVDNRDTFTRENLQQSQVAIEFTNPLSAAENVMRCLYSDIPVVSGSTGWYSKLDEAKSLCLARSGAMLCASNFSLGMNIFFEVNRTLARLMRKFPDYKARIEETHHTRKLDTPSGTAITLAEGILDEIPALTRWELDGEAEDVLPIHAIREGDIPGTHKVKYASAIDDIEIVHTAHSRQGFALGAVLAAEYISNKKGIFTMKNLLGLKN
ncbi:MAG: 4-hydroxy-tetrahydrodipicolinate reductase [Bacteroidales bacterium]|jgi:4-hydroxy-tetrahydrodipicolinate reductase|nr:4-hydroxy-tetrahydrodipicolinate reductase [Bacteroidales bacterium]